MGLRKDTLRKYKRIFTSIEKLVSDKRVNSVWHACGIVARKYKMTAPSVSVIYYRYRKMIQSPETM